MIEYNASKKMCICAYYAIVELTYLYSISLVHQLTVYIRLTVVAEHLFLMNEKIQFIMFYCYVFQRANV